MNSSTGHYGRFSRIPSFFARLRVPHAVRIEASSVCQLRCPVCPQNDGRLLELGRGHLQFSHFKAFLERHKGVRRVELSNWGELFLNPELEEMIAYSAGKSVRLTAYNGSNLNAMSPGMPECLVRYSFEAITVSIDGLSPGTYEIYRKGGSLRKVFEHIRAINHYKALYDSVRPELIWQFIAFGHNEHEILEAKRMAASLNMRFSLKLNGAEGFSPVQNETLVASLAGAGSRSNFMKKLGRPYRRPCHQFWLSPQIHHDGAFLGCCYNTSHSFGNVFQLGLGPVMRRAGYGKILRIVSGSTEDIAGTPCETCKVYSKMRELNCFYLPPSFW